MALRKWRWWIAIGVAVLAVFLLGMGILRARQRQRGADIADGQTPAPLGISSTSFSDGHAIPRRLTCDGAGLSPEIAWPLQAAGTRSFAIVMDDPDTPFGFVHWLVYDIPAGTRDIAEGASSQAKLPHGTAEGMNSLDNTGYFGPCPPAGKPHHYVLRLYALDADLGLPPGMTKKQLAAAVKGHVLAEGQMTGLYSRGAGE